MGIALIIIGYAILTLFIVLSHRNLSTELREREEVFYYIKSMLKNSTKREQKSLVLLEKLLKRSDRILRKLEKI